MNRGLSLSPCLVKARPPEHSPRSQAICAIKAAEAADHGVQRLFREAAIGRAGAQSDVGKKYRLERLVHCWKSRSMGRWLVATALLWSRLRKEKRQEDADNLANEAQQGLYQEGPPEG